MMKTKNIFTVCLLALFLTPAFAGTQPRGTRSPTQPTAGSEQKADPTVETANKINASTEKLKIGGSLVVNQDHLKTSENTITDAGRAFNGWNDKCKSLVQAAGGDVNQSYTNKNPESNTGTATYTCLIKKCTDAAKKPSKDGTKCEEDKHAKGKECKDSYFGVGTYDASGKCVITKCSDENNYTFNKDKKKCELKTTSNIRENQTDKAYDDDINALIEAYNTVVQKYVSACKAKGGSIKDKKCTVE